MKLMYHVDKNIQMSTSGMENRIKIGLWSDNATIGTLRCEVAAGRTSAATSGWPAGSGSGSGGGDASRSVVSRRAEVIPQPKSRVHSLVICNLMSQRLWVFLHSSSSGSLGFLAKKTKKIRTVVKYNKD